jgi:hypothetical protein
MPDPSLPPHWYISLIHQTFPSSTITCELRHFLKSWTAKGYGPTITYAMLDAISTIPYAEANHLALISNNSYPESPSPVNLSTIRESLLPAISIRRRI